MLFVKYIQYFIYINLLHESILYRATQQQSDILDTNPHHLDLSKYAFRTMCYTLFSSRLK